MAELGECLTEFLGKEHAKVQGFGVLTVANRLISNSEVSSALILLRAAASSFLEKECFEVLAEISRTSKLIGGLDDLQLEPLHRILSRIANISQLKSWFYEIDFARKRLKTKEFQQFLRNLRRQSYGISQNHQLSKREAFHRTKLHARIDRALQDNINWIDSSRSIVEQLKATPWLSENYNLDMISEMRTLAQLYWYAGDYDTFWQIDQQLNGISPSSPRAELEKALHDFPFMFVVAIEARSKEFGLRYSRKFEDAIYRGSFRTSPKMLTLSYYWQAYFHFFIGEYANSEVALSHLYRHPKSEVLPHINTMAEILSSALAIESHQEDECIRILANLAKSNRISAISGSKLVVQLLSSLARLLPEINRESIESLYLTEVLQEVKQEPITNYFDFEGWLQSKKESCPMLEIKRDKTTSIKILNA